MREDRSPSRLPRSPGGGYAAQHEAGEGVTRRPVVAGVARRSRALALRPPPPTVPAPGGRLPVARAAPVPLLRGRTIRKAPPSRAGGAPPAGRTLGRRQSSEADGVDPPDDGRQAEAVGQPAEQEHAGGQEVDHSGAGAAQVEAVCPEWS